MTAPHGRVLVRAADDTLAEACARLERVFGLVSLSPAARGAARHRGDRPPPRSRRPAPPSSAIPPSGAASASRPAARTSGSPSPRRRSACAWAPTSHQATGVPGRSREPGPGGGRGGGPRGGLRLRRDARGARRPAGGHARASALLLLSGGIDSPVAGWLAAKRGLTLEGVYFHSPPFVGEKSRDKVLSLARDARPLAGAARAARGALHRDPEAAARGRPGRAGGGAVPPHDDAGRGPDRRPHPGARPWSPARTWARSPARPWSTWAPSRPPPAGWCCGRWSPTTSTRPSRWPAASGPTTCRSSPTRTAARCSCPPTPPPAPALADVERAEAGLDLAAEAAALAARPNGPA